MDVIKYYNRNGNLMFTFNEFDDEGNCRYFIDSSDLKNWVWAYDEEFGRIQNFRRIKGSYKIAVYVLTRSKADRDALCDIFDEDVQAEQAGWFEVRGWKQKCFVVEADHDYMDDEIEWRVKFEIITETSTWTRENTTSYSGIIAEEVDIDLGRDYSLETGDTESGRGYGEGVARAEEYLNDEFGFRLEGSHDSGFITAGYPESEYTLGYGYSVVTDYNEREIILPNDGNGFRVVFYGAITNPVIYMDGKPVTVNITLAEGERLVLTSNGREKTIYKYSAVGEKTDAFIYRDKENSPFFSLGKNTILSFGEIKFDLTTIENRSEPSWN